MKRLIAPVAALILVTACGDGDPAATFGTVPPVTSSTASTSSTATPGSTAPTEDTVSLSDSARALVDVAISDLAQREAADVGDIEVVEFERVVWSNGSLGCPEPGVMYTQALVDGWRVVLGLDGTNYSYHAGRDDIPFLCERPTLPSRGGTGS